MASQKEVGLLAWLSVRKEVSFRETEILRIVYLWQCRGKLQVRVLFIMEFGALPRGGMQINLTSVFISANVHILYQIGYT